VAAEAEEQVAPAAGPAEVRVLALAAEVLELVEQARAALEAVQQLEQEVEGRAQPELQVRREAQARAPAAAPGAETR
jgi:hypothetical protein